VVLQISLIRNKWQEAHRAVRMTEWFKVPDSSFGPRERAWVQIPLLTRRKN
jgi:hypothetical protein